MPEVLKRKTVDWISLFDNFDTDKKGVITKIDIKGMIQRSGFEFVTDAEV